MNIRYVEYKNIDKKKWDNCISNAQNGNVYAYSWYLDIVAIHWDALITEDYAIVFPLPSNRKLFGYQQVFQPLFTQQLGIYSLSTINENLVQNFLEAIPKHFKLIVANINENNPISTSVDFSIHPKTNILLDLHLPYEILNKNYSKSLRKNLRRADKILSITQQSIPTNDLVNLYKETVGSKITGLNDKAYEKITAIINTAIQQNMGRIIGVENSGGEIFAAGFFLFSHHRIINLFGSSSIAGRSTYAMHFLLDAIIKENAQTQQIFDFEGSSIPSIATFFKSFGSTEVLYHRIQKDNLPFWIRKIKSI